MAGDSVNVEYRKRDRWGRLIGKVLHNGKDMNLAVLSAGLAWVYRKSDKELSADDKAMYYSAEESAKATGVGLWTDPDPVAPWIWRKKK